MPSYLVGLSVGFRYRSTSVCSSSSVLFSTRTRSAYALWIGDSGSFTAVSILSLLFSKRSFASLRSSSLGESIKISMACVSGGNFPKRSIAST